MSQIQTYKEREMENVSEVNEIMGWTERVFVQGSVKKRAALLNKRIKKNEENTLKDSVAYEKLKKNRSKNAIQYFMDKSGVWWKMIGDKISRAARKSISIRKNTQTFDNPTWASTTTPQR